MTGPSERIDHYAKQSNGWTPALLPEPPPEMTPRQLRRFMQKLQARKRHPHGEKRCLICRPEPGSPQPEHKRSWRWR